MENDKGCRFVIIEFPKMLDNGLPVCITDT